MTRQGRRRANNEGTIYRRKDGRWEGAAYVITTDGTRKRRRVYGRTREEAHRRLTEMIRQSQQGMPAAATSQTVAEYLNYWLEYVARHRVRPSTFRSYSMYVREHFIPALGKKRLARLTAREVREFLNSKRGVESRSPATRRKGLSPRTIYHMHGVLRNALEHAVREDLIPRNVVKQVQVSPGYREAVEPLSVEEAKKLLQAARDDRLYALYAVALSLGLRRSEALGLRWEDIDFEKGVLRVRQTLHRHAGGLEFSPPKTPRSRRTIPLPRICLEALQEHREEQDRQRQLAGPQWQESGLVFTSVNGTPLEPSTYSNEFRRLCKRASIRRIRLHDLRHTCASLLLAQGVPPRVVMEVLGHSSLDVTMNIYGHVMLDAQRDALGRIDDLFGD